MVIGLIVVVLLVVGGGVAFAMRSKKSGGSSSGSSGSTGATVSSADRLAGVLPDSAAAGRDQMDTVRDTSIRHSDISTNASPKPEAKSTPPTPPTQRAAGADVVASTETDEDEQILDRFAAPGQRAAGATDYRPTTPRKTEYLSTEVESVPEPVVESVAEPEPVVESEPSVEQEPAFSFEPVPGLEPELEFTPEPETEFVAHSEPDPVPEPEAVIEPELAPEPEFVGAIEPDPVPDTEPVTEYEPEPESEFQPVADQNTEQVIDLVSAEDQGGISDSLHDLDSPVDSTDNSTPGPNGHVDMVLQALIGRVRATDADVADVAEELVERAGLDAEEMAEVLTDLVERVEADHGIPLGDRSEELTLFSEKVPRRPGQITDFAELGLRERRRVIIRVLCLLVARSEETKREAAEAAETAGSGDEGESQWPLARAVWPSATPAADEDADLPARRNRLARLRR